MTERAKAFPIVPADNLKQAARAVPGREPLSPMPPLPEGPSLNRPRPVFVDSGAL